MTITSIQDYVTKTEAFTGTGVDVSGLVDGSNNPVDWTIKLQVAELTAAKKVRIMFEDTVNNFTASVAGPVFSYVGALGTTYDKVKSFKKQDFPDLRIGVSNGKIRCSVGLIDSNASVTYKAWIEY